MAFGAAEYRSSDGEAFFSQLPTMHLNRQEERLLHALRESLVAVNAMHLPSSVTVKEWVQRRVPHEETSLSRLWSLREYDWQESSSTSARVPMLPHPIKGTKRQNDDQRSGKRQCKNIFAKDPPMSEEERRAKAQEFFSSFPHEDFTADEIKLREALLDFLHSRAEIDPGTAPAVMEVKDPKKGAPRVTELCSIILPIGVGLRDWIENRIASEVEVQWDDARRCSVLVLLDGPEDCDNCITEANDHNTCEGPEGASESTETLDSNHAKVEDQSHIDKVNSFLSMLPQDAFTDREIELRDALFEFLDWHEQRHPGVVPPVSQAGLKGSRVHRLMKRLLPRNVGLRHWINHRIGGELQATYDDVRGCTVITRV